MGFQEACNTGLALGLGCEMKMGKNNSPLIRLFSLSSTSLTKTNEPSLTLGLSAESYEVTVKNMETRKVCENSMKSPRPVSPQTPVSSYSNSSVKRDKGMGSHEEIQIERTSSRVSDEDEEGSTRKKLRLTKPQSALLEDSFKDHSTLNPKEKLALAKQLNLRPRQVEVWFQNRRARTKLKQTEAEYEVMKKCCKSLTEENQRLQKELHELQALKLAPSLYMQLPAATLSMCPSCEKISGGGGALVGESSTKSNLFKLAPKSHMFNPYMHPSAAC
ncbi:hypothetical protein GIB67_015292 [Kingdonia uniflora]|uniref:Homeobox domain-containing protein n=1 Tax=Kingdonia uniflora TaxID=39325 RepID=A0A7J7MSV9_9MAGN|nr:hypothetical protein GIB67_015292 [Kingdonia uniflora]